jgi:hypothetical protein
VITESVIIEFVLLLKDAVESAVLTGGSQCSEGSAYYGGSTAFRGAGAFGARECPHLAFRQREYFNGVLATRFAVEG